MEKRNTVFKNYLSSKVSCNAFFREKLKAVGLVQPFNVNAKMLAFSKQSHVAYKENIVLLKYLVKIY